MDNDNIGEGAALPSRPLGFWLRAVDRLLERAFDAAFADEGVTRRDWRILNLIDGDVDAPGLVERLRGKKLRPLEDRGWVTRTDAGWTLTDEGRAAKERLGAIVAGIRSKVTGAVSDDDYATTLASLEAIARGLGWSGSERMPRGRGLGRGFGPGRGFGGGRGRGFGHGFRPGHGFGPRHGFGPGHGIGPEHGFDGFGPRHGHRGHGVDPGHGECGHGHRHGARHAGHRTAEDAYERGFQAGFTRGEGRRDA